MSDSWKAFLEGSRSTLGSAFHMVLDAQGFVPMEGLKFSLFIVFWLRWLVKADNGLTGHITQANCFAFLHN